MQVDDLLAQHPTCFPEPTWSDPEHRDTIKLWETSSMTNKQNYTKMLGLLLFGFCLLRSHPVVIRSWFYLWNNFGNHMGCWEPDFECPTNYIVSLYTQQCWDSSVLGPATRWWWGDHEMQVSGPESELYQYHTTTAMFSRYLQKLIRFWFQ